MASSASWSSGGGKADTKAYLWEWWGHAAGLLATWTRLSLPGALVAGWMGEGDWAARWVVPLLVGPLSTGLYALAYQVIRAVPILPLELLKAADTLLLGAAALGSGLLLNAATGVESLFWIPGGLLWALAWSLNWGPSRIRRRSFHPVGAAGLPSIPHFLAPASGPVTAGFRSYDATHVGLDIGLERGSPVTAPADGIVTRAGPYDQWGYAVMLDHCDGWTTLLAHLERPLTRPGQRVAAGEVVGLSGASGISTGPHLHLEFRFRGVPVDPIPLLADGRLHIPARI